MFSRRVIIASRQLPVASEDEVPAPQPAGDGVVPGVGAAAAAGRPPGALPLHTPRQPHHPEQGGAAPRHGRGPGLDSAAHTTSAQDLLLQCYQRGGMQDNTTLITVSMITISIISVIFS